MAANRAAEVRRLLDPVPDDAALDMVRLDSPYKPGQSSWFLTLEPPAIPLVAPRPKRRVLHLSTLRVHLADGAQVDDVMPRTHRAVTTIQAIRAKMEARIRRGRKVARPVVTAVIAIMEQRLRPPLETAA